MFQVKIRVHADSSESSNISGAAMLVPSPIGNAKDISEISRQYGQVVLESLIDEVCMKNKGVVERTDTLIDTNFTSYRHLTK